MLQPTISEPVVVNLIQGRRVDFIAYGGDTAPTSFRMLDRVTKEPINLAGVNIRMDILTPKSEGPPVAQFATGGNISISGDGMNRVTILSWASVPAGKYEYDMQFIFPSGQVITYMYGKVTVQKDKTPL